MNKNRIAILGAGGLGVCAALELAGRGYQIDLYEEHSSPLKKASYVNEGKIHLGLIYAMDKDLKTSKHMITGALHFMDNLNRWIDLKPENAVSTPFYYGVHKGSLMTPNELMNHYRQCDSFFMEAKNYYKKSYLNLLDRVETIQLPSSQMDGIVDSKYIEALFSTSEYAIDPRAVAEKLSEALNREKSIQLHLNTKVTGVKEQGNGYQVESINQDQKSKEYYPEVINCSWNGLLEIDRTMGIEPEYKWSHRYKFGNKILIPVKKEDTPSITMVQGPFGDIVNFKQRGLFASWYPIGRTGWSENHRPPEWDSMYSKSERYDVFQRSLAELAKRIPVLKNLKFEEKDVEPVGGVIYAYGNTDVDSEKSHLHSRYEVGIRTFGKYHTVNTGKYTLVPYLALKLANRVDGKDN